MEPKPQNHEPVENPWTILSQEDVQATADYFISGIQEELAGAEGVPVFRAQASAVFNERLRDLLEDSSDLTDEDYFLFLQIAVRQNQRIRKGAPAEKEGNPLLYRSVDRRCVDDPDFTDTFVRFATDLYNYNHEVGGEGSRYWKTLIDKHETQAWQESIRLEDPKQMKESPWIKAFRNIRANRQIRSNTDDRPQSAARSVESPTQRREFFTKRNIAAKDTAALLAISEELDRIPPSLVFGLSEQRSEIITKASAMFRQLLQEAGKAGWGNAKVLLARWDQVMAPNRRELRDLEGYEVIIYLSNLIVTSIQSEDSPMPDTFRPTQIGPKEVENTQEAIDRCMYIVFECGSKRPKNIDPVNFMITAEILGKMFIEAQALRVPDSMEDAETPASYEAFVIDSRTQRDHWKQWKAGYGIFI